MDHYAISAVRVLKRNHLRTELIAVMVVLLYGGMMPTSLPVAQATAIFLGSSLSDLREFPEEVQDVMGYAIHKAQVGGKHPSAKPLTGDPAFRGAGVLEVVDNFEGSAFRAVYTVKFSTVVYVLHAFQKKATAGISHAVERDQADQDSTENGERSLQAKFSGVGGRLTRSPFSRSTPDGMRKKRTDHMNDDTSIIVSSGNVFADLGLPDADERLLKARIITLIDDIIARQGLSQKTTAERLGIAQSDVSRLLSGRSKGFSLERLFGFAVALGSDIEIKIKQPDVEREGHMRLMVA